MKLLPGDVAYRCNMVTFEDTGAPFEEKKILSHSAGGIDGETSAALVSDLFDTPVPQAGAVSGYESLTGQVVPPYRRTARRRS